MKKDRKYLIVGLGNAEDKYGGTRHNIGFEVVTALVKSLKGSFRAKDFAYVAEVTYEGHPLVVIMPTTYMNLSGKAVRYWLKESGVFVDSLLVVSDDIDLPVGDLRLKPKGSGGSHNGLLDITEVLGHGSFPRLRFGIGKNYKQGYQINYVLSKFTSQELENYVKPAIAKSVELIKMFVVKGLSITMNQYNTRPKRIEPADEDDYRE